MKTRVHILIDGLVQGVCFRHYARIEAGKLDVRGWIRNMSDGRVEVVGEGTPEAVARLVAWCRRGPPGARVTGVQETYGPPTDDYTTFEVHY